MTNDKIYRVGLVGAGYVSEFHINALKRLPYVHIVGITDLDESRAKATAQRFGIASYASLEELGREGLDVVHVLTPPDSHLEVTLAALSLGCHALVEKPLATSVEDCDRLIAESQARGLRVCVDHSLLGDPLVKRALDLVNSGVIGDVLAVEYVRSSTYPPYRGGPLSPQYREGGYQFRDLGVHGVYLLRAFLGTVEDIRAEFRHSGVKGNDPNIFFDEWRAWVHCQKGTGSIQLSWNVKPLQHQLLIQGTQGTLHADLFAMYLTRRRHTPLPKAAERVVNVFAEAWSSVTQLSWNAALFAAGRIEPYQGLHNFVAAFYESLRANTVMPTSLEQARESVLWTEQVSCKADDAKSQFYRQYRRGHRAAVVVTGATGLLGGAILTRLLQQGETVRVFVRQLPRPEIVNNPHVEIVLGDLGDPKAVNDALEGAKIVFHVGAAMSGGEAAHESATIAGTRNIVDACLTYRIRKMIHISSLSVIDWAGHPADQPVTESAALEPAAHKRGYYTRAKLEAERIVREAAEHRGLPTVILRPGQIWVETKTVMSPALGIRVRNHLIVIGDESNQIPFVHLDDVVDATLLAMQSGFSSGEIFQLVDRDLITRKELVRLYVLSREPRLKATHIPLPLACFLAGGIETLTDMLHRPAPVSPYRLRSATAPLMFDCTKAREELGWLPRRQTGGALRALLSGSNCLAPMNRTQRVDPVGGADS